MQSWESLVAWLRLLSTTQTAQCKCAADTSLGHFGKGHRVVHTLAQSPQDAHAADAEHVGSHAGELDVAGLQEFLDAVALISPLANQRRAIASQGTEVADL